MIVIEWLKDLVSIITKQHVYNLLLSVLILLIGLFLARRARATFSTLPQLDTQQRLVLSKVSYYVLIAAAFAAALGQLGFDVRVLLGAAGVLTVAIGFAAQTSASNLISGLFLMADRPFVVGDFVSIGDIKGEVLSIDLLSSKIRTFNNTLVRIPNETMVKSNITNLSYYPVRRVDFNISVAHHTDIEALEKLLRRVAATNPLCLEEPQPIFLFNGFGESAMLIQFQVWTLSANMQKLQNELYREFKSAFDKEGVEIPFPTRQLLSPPVAGGYGQARV